MTRSAASFRQADVARAVRGVKAGGERVASVEITPEGRILILTGSNEEQPVSALEAWRKKRGGRAA